MDFSYDNDILKLDENAIEVFNRSFDEYPEFIKTPLFTRTVLNPEEHYNLQITDPFLMKVYNLDRVCTTMSTYFKAMEIYDKYMERVYNYYGGKNQMKMAIKRGYNNVFIPQKPNINGDYKKLRNLIKSGAPNTEIGYTVDLAMTHEEELSDIANGAYETGGEKDFEVRETNGDKKLNNIFKNVIKDRRVATLFTTLYRNSGYTPFHSYSEESLIDQENSNIIKSLENATIEPNGDLLTSYKSDKDESFVNDFITEKLYSELSDIDRLDLDEAKYVYYNGYMKHGRTESQIEYYQDMRAGGLPVIAMMKSRVPKKMRNEVGNTLKGYVGEDPTPEGATLDVQEETLKRLKKLKKIAKRDKEADDLTHSFADAMGLYNSIGDIESIRQLNEDINSFDSVFNVSSSSSLSDLIKDDNDE